MLPAGTFSVGTLSGPKKTPTCCTLDLAWPPTKNTSVPCSTVPPYTRPVATSPACLSTDTLVTITAKGPSGLVLTMVWPASLSMSPSQMLGHLYCWETSGEGKCSTTIPNNTSAKGTFLANSFWFSSLQ